MGCSASADTTQTIKAEPQVPKKKVDRAMLVVNNKKGETIERKRGDIDNNPFQADELTDCVVVIKDFVNTMTIDRCYNCKFSMSAIKGSLFVRDCQDCVFTINCAQFRCRNCSNCSFFVHSKTGPVIEASSNLKIGCGTFSYDGVLEDLEFAGIDKCESKFDDVYDFTPGEGHMTLVVGEKCELPSETCELPLLYPEMPGAEYASASVPINNWNELCRISFTELKIVSIKNSGDHFDIKVDGDANDVISKVQSL